MTDAPELLPCPFCGGGAQISRAHQNKMLAMGEVATDEHYLFTLHHACNPTLNDGVSVCWTYKPKAALIAAWNRRTPATVSGDLREVVARAIGEAAAYPHAGAWYGAADAALSALTPHIAAEIAALESERDALLAANEKMRDALEEAASRFVDYAEMHAIKLLDGSITEAQRTTIRGKVDRNFTYAYDARAALPAPPADGKG